MDIKMEKLHTELTELWTNTGRMYRLKLERHRVLRTKNK